jgi:glycosyltransferase involved in cell wall biosynthesis
MNQEFVLSIVIPTHNKKDDVVRCINALLVDQFEFGKFEIVVVDDGSIDPPKPLIEKIDTKGIPVKVVRLEGNGPACARNEGIKNAKAPIIAFIDDDAVPQPGYLHSIFKPFEDSNIVGVEGKVVPVNCKKMGLLGMSPRSLEGGVYLTCNIAFRSEILYKVGGLDESFPFPAFEDVDLAEAIKPYGEIAWAPDAEVHHPCRKWSLKRAIREIKFNEPLVLFARRYGHMGWEDRPTRYPALRTYLSSVITLPVGRMLKGLKGIFTNRPIQAIQYFFISFFQGLFASILVIKPIIKGLKGDVERKKYL